MNDKCLNLKKSSKKKDKELSGCPHYKSQSIQNTLRDFTLVLIYSLILITLIFFINLYFRLM